MILKPSGSFLTQNAWLGIFCTKFPGTQKVSFFSYDRLTCPLVGRMELLTHWNTNKMVNVPLQKGAKDKGILLQYKNVIFLEKIVKNYLIKSHKNIK